MDWKNDYSLILRLEDVGQNFKQLDVLLANYPISRFEEAFEGTLWHYFIYSQGMCGGQFCDDLRSVIRLSCRICSVAWTNGAIS